MALLKQNQETEAAGHLSTTQEDPWNHLPISGSLCTAEAMAFQTAANHLDSKEELRAKVVFLTD